MLQIAVPNKGALSERAVSLLTEAGYRCARSGRELIVKDQENDVNFIFLRPRDIAVYVGKGVLDAGITGRDLTTDSNAPVVEIMPLEFGRSRFCFAAPADSGMTVQDLEGKRIATSYPELLRKNLEKMGISAEIVKLDGAVEISVKLGVADAIADVVESGRTLVEAGLKTVGDVVMESEAIVIGHDEQLIQQPEVKKILARLRGVLVARDYVLIEYNVPRSMLDACCKITPGIESPTISPLSNPDWVAVKAMIKSGQTNVIMDELQEKGAKGIFVTALNSCRI